MFDDEDMDEIKQIFVEESNEGLDIMESGLLELKPGSSDSETINNIFRAAHSIKGGGGTFGFTKVSDFTHGVETLLDEVRSGSRQITEDIIQLFLESVDCLRGMLQTINDGADYDDERISQLSSRIQTFLDQSVELHQSTPLPSDSSKKSSLADDTKEQNTPTAIRQWSIIFNPYPDVIKGGNEPYRIFRELAKLGELKIEADLEELPDFTKMDPESCYLAWDLSLVTEANEEEIDELFSWVFDECALNIREKVDENEKIEEQLVAIETGTDTEDKVSTAIPVENTAAPQITRPPTPAAAGSGVKQKSKGAANSDSGSVRVSISKIDSLLDLVGELVITQSMLARFGKEEFGEDALEELADGLEQLGRNTRELQESAMQIRMLPIKVVFSRFPRLIRDLGSKLNKKIHLDIQGETTEIDKLVMEKIGDPLVHLVRNSVDHGIESIDVRQSLGKPEMGTITLSATQEAGNVVITIGDDGAGLNKDKILKKAIEKGLIIPSDQLTDEAIYNLIFQPGFSTVDAVSDLSGRGVGMDVVQRNISDLGGRVTIKSEAGLGSEIIVRLPLTLAIMEGQLVRVDNAVYIIPLLSIIESVLVDVDDLNLIGHGLLVYHFRGEHIPIISLGNQGCFGSRCSADNLKQLENKLLIICEFGGAKMGLLVDSLSEQQQVVIKTLETNFQKRQGLLGATILGDGKVALILDMGGLAASFMHSNEHESISQVIQRNGGT